MSINIAQLKEMKKKKTKIHDQFEIILPENAKCKDYLFEINS